MTIKENKVILYSDLINNAVDKIVSLCHNVDRTIPDYFKLNNSETILNNGKVTITNILKTQPPVRISRSIVESELKDFLAKRGILQNDDEVVSAKTLLNFSGNFSSFVAIHVRTFTRRLSNLTCYLSSTDTTSYPISLGRNQLGSTPVTQENSVTNLNEIMRNVNVQNRIENLSLTFTFACSSSSSSCSSSSSSSSSSSCCTSIFIAYMKI